MQVIAHDADPVHELVQAGDVVPILNRAHASGHRQAEQKAGPARGSSLCLGGHPELLNQEEEVGLVHSPPTLGNVSGVLPAKRMVGGGGGVCVRGHKATQVYRGEGLWKGLTDM